MAAYQLHSTVQVAASLLVHRDPVSASLGKLWDVLIRILNHQVTIKRQFRRLAQRSHDRRPNGHVGYKMAVHDVDVEDGTAALGCGAYLIRQAGEVCRQNRRCEFDQTWALEQGDTREILSSGADYRAAAFPNYQLPATNYCSLAYSAFASWRIGTSGSASFQSARKSW